MRLASKEVETVLLCDTAPIYS